MFVDFCCYCWQYKYNTPALPLNPEFEQALQGPHFQAQRPDCAIRQLNPTWPARYNSSVLGPADPRTLAAAGR